MAIAGALLARVASREPDSSPDARPQWVRDEDGRMVLKRQGPPIDWLRRVMKGAPQLLAAMRESPQHDRPAPGSSQPPSERVEPLPPQPDSLATPPPRRAFREQLLPSRRPRRSRPVEQVGSAAQVPVKAPTQEDASTTAQFQPPISKRESVTTPPSVRLRPQPSAPALTAAKPASPLGEPAVDSVAPRSRPRATQGPPAMAVPARFDAGRPAVWPREPIRHTPTRLEATPILTVVPRPGAPVLGLAPRQRVEAAPPSTIGRRSPSDSPAGDLASNRAAAAWSPPDGEPSLRRPFDEPDISPEPLTGRWPDLPQREPAPYEAPMIVEAILRRQAALDAEQGRR